MGAPQAAVGMRSVPPGSDADAIRGIPRLGFTVLLLAARSTRCDQAH
jgi:hypothetical protein